MQRQTLAMLSFGAALLITAMLSLEVFATEHGEESSEPTVEPYELLPYESPTLEPIEEGPTIESYEGQDCGSGYETGKNVRYFATSFSKNLFRRRFDLVEILAAHRHVKRVVVHRDTDDFRLFHRPQGLSQNLVCC